MNDNEFVSTKNPFEPHIEFNAPRTVYLAGKITGDKNYRQKFREAEEALSSDGSIVLSPIVLPQGFNWDAYTRMTRAMMNECCIVAFLPDWEESEGAKAEMEDAKKQRKEIVFLKRVPYGFDIDEDKYIPGNTIFFYKRVVCNVTNEQYLKWKQEHVRNDTQTPTYKNLAPMPPVKPAKSNTGKEDNKCTLLQKDI